MTLTLNEVREALLQDYPEHTIVVRAECWYEPQKRGIRRRGTYFSARIFDKHDNARAHEAGTTQELLAAFRAAPSFGRDHPASVEPEGEYDDPE